MSPNGNVIIPEFDQYTRIPRSPKCKPLDVNRIVVEVLGYGENHAAKEFSESDYSGTALIEGKKAIMMRYRRERDDSVRPAACMSYEENENGIKLLQIQGTKDRKVAFRFASGFNYPGYFMKFLEKNFTDNGFSIDMDIVPSGLEGASFGSNAHNIYDGVRKRIQALNISIK